MEQALTILVAIILAGLLALAAAVGAWKVVRRRIERRLAARGGLVVMAVSGLWQGSRWLMNQPASSPSWWAVQRDRRRLSGATASAQRAVEQAQRSGASVGDLPRLARQLEQAAGHLDECLMAGGTGVSGWSARRSCRSQLESVIDSASCIEATARQALERELAPQLSSLSSAVRLEHQAMSAGLKVARSGAD